MSIIPQIIGLLAVAAFLLSYQLKKRSNIIFLNIVSRFLYILQYLLLSAFSGAVFDILAAFSSVLASKKSSSFIQKYIKAIVAVINVCIVATGAVIAYLNKSFLDLFALAGVLLEINALWLTGEKAIRWVSLFAAPFWFIYNYFSHAYGSAIGNIFTIISIIIAIIKYRNMKPEKDKE